MANALVNETSPYLLQHAENPVNWVPWSESAFERARVEDKMVFLSIGYSTCHWCHVMERESFENPAIAELLNEWFVCVKVDREERPDVDATYMAFVQATTGQGGWPMTVWLTPEGKPAVGGTYFPPEDRHGRAGLARLCREVGRLWKEDRAKMEGSAERILEHLREESAPGAVVQGLPGMGVFGDFLDRCESMFQPGEGGWGGAPKFPRPVVPRLLLRLAERFGRQGDEGQSCLQMVERTLSAMAAGGIHDQLAGGFHRYSVDRYWHVPHYEKMLYDQAQLALVYLECWQSTGEEMFREVAEGIFGYVLGEMRDETGGFHAAEDADSLPEEGGWEKREGAFWTWSAEEIYRLLSPEAAAVFSAAYGVELGGNARPESDPLEELVGRNTLYQAIPVAVLAERFEKSETELESSLAESRRILLAHRMRRPLPHRDDKILTAWNGLMIQALAFGARVLERPDWLEAAQQAAAFIRRELWNGTTLFRSFRKKNSGIDGFASDYAFLIAGLLELHAADGNAAHLSWVVELQEKMQRDFWDGEYGGYVTQARLGGKSLLKMREDYDGAEPSAGHVAVENLLRLACLLDRPEYQKLAEIMMRAEARVAAKQPFSVPVLLGALDLLERGVMKIEVGENVEGELAEKLRRTYLPRAVFVRGESADEVRVCEGMQCHPPVRSVVEWESLISR